MRFDRWYISSGYWLILAGWAGLIFWFSSRTSDEIPTIFGMVSDKLLHAVAFGLFTMLFLLAANRGLCRPVRPSLMLISVLVTLLYGMLDEWHQSMVETRVASIADLLADGTGSIAALPCFAVLSRFFRDRFCICRPG